MRRLPRYLLAFLLPPIVAVIVIGTSSFSALNRYRAPEPLTPEEAPLPASPRRDPSKLLAVVLVSNVGTQLTEALATHEILTRSGKFQVWLAAPHRVLSATTAPVAILPDLALAEVPRPDAIIVPSVMDAPQRERVEWLRENASRARWLVTLGEGEKVVDLADLPDAPAPARIRNAGGVRSIAAALELIRAARDEAAASGLAREIGWSWMPTQDPTPADESQPELSRTDMLPLAKNAALNWAKPRIAVHLDSEISGLKLALLLDPMPRSMNRKVFTVSDHRVYLPTSSGAQIVATTSVGQAEIPDALVTLISDVNADASGMSLKNSLTQTWVESLAIPTLPIQDANIEEFTRQVYRFLEQSDGRESTRLAALSLRVPDRIRQAWESEPAPVIDQRPVYLPLIFLGALGVLFLAILERRLKRTN